MLAARRISDKDEPCHSRFQHDRIIGIQTEHYPLAHAPNVANRPPHRPATKPIDPRRNRNRFPSARHTFHVLDPRTNNPQHTPPHRLDFW
jgi:hypothetical protein